MVTMMMMVVVVVMLITIIMLLKTRRVTTKQSSALAHAGTSHFQCELGNFSVVENCTILIGS